MAESIDKILDFLGKYSWAVVVLAAFVLFLPDDASQQIGLLELRNSYKGYWWLGLVLSGAIWMKSVFSYLDKRLFEVFLAERTRKKKRESTEFELLKSLELRLRSLDREEVYWIMYCLFNNVQTLSAEMTNGTANSLLYKGIVTRGSGHALSLPFHIPDVVWRYLLDHRDEFVPTDIEESRLKAELEKFRKSLHLF